MKLNSIVRLAYALACASLLQSSAATAATETVLYSFKGGSDGANPTTGLTNVRGTLYGATPFGGVYQLCGGRGCGTVFSVATSGAEKVVHSFGSGGDGSEPLTRLINVDGTLYGTTNDGGTYGVGTVFAITNDDTELVLHSFGNGSDGQYPGERLIDVKGTFYGTTGRGGNLADCRNLAGAGCGTVFSITPEGTENVLYAFQGGSDGESPGGPLLSVKGTLYGMSGRSGSGCLGTGCGMVFSITSGGTENVLYAFDGNDGGGPNGGLIKFKSKLYGLTTGGGGPGCNGYGCGTMFSLTLTGTETVLYSFKGGSDGASPIGPLLNVNGTFYGTTGIGGAYNMGTVFSITPGGTETVLYSFKGGSDGAYPYADLVSLDGRLYGTTNEGGTGTCMVYDINVGCGTVFAITP